MFFGPLNVIPATTNQVTVSMDIIFNLISQALSLIGGVTLPCQHAASQLLDIIENSSSESSIYMAGVSNELTPIQKNKVLTTMVIEPLEDHAYCARSAFTHLGL